MRRVYLSSTIGDLEEFRTVAADALRNCGYDVDWMERYAARDERPKAACESDVAKADYYVGIFAWRYGYVPEDNNPERRSITELEYPRGRSRGKAALHFSIGQQCTMVKQAPRCRTGVG